MKKTLWIAAVLFVFTLTACSQQEELQQPDYRYKLQLTGTLPNAAVPTTFTVLTNDATLTFEEVANSLLSSNLQDDERIDVYLVE